MKKYCLIATLKRKNKKTAIKKYITSIIFLSNFIIYNKDEKSVNIVYPLEGNQEKWHI